ncbi:hypothetical protein ACTQ33_12305 [Candidatus Avoscillospira sp. LCP25S3_F1]|uniref:hypothetical protein n=1 Tax=Candidatus Avoscillospira sp. LCP25S3_F1 TaxID=3438825 RepID=UPI003F90CE7E
MNRYLISFDDTDELNMPGTGHLLDGFLQTLSARCSFISRHQLFVHADVSYTSHNSAMCAQIDGGLSTEDLIGRAAAYLEQHSAPGADPGLCVADWGTMMQPELLVLWGYRAKREVLAKEDAYFLARQCGVHLSEHGGTGQGVVGALAAVGLRLAGQDGRVKGKRQLEQDRLTVRDLLRSTGFDRVCAYGLGELPPDAVICINGQPIKAVYQNFCATVLAVPERDQYRLLPKEQLKCF